MAITPRLRKRIQRANRAVSMARLMIRLGYRVTQADAEQQFACDLHGPDNKPSARLYPRTNSTYCWACHKPRRPVDLMKEREGVSLDRAVSMLEEMFDLPSLPIHEEVEEEIISEEGPSLDDEIFRTERLLTTMTHERSVSLDRALWAWERFDQALTLAEREELTVEAARAVLCGLREKMLADARGSQTGNFM